MSDTPTSRGYAWAVQTDYATQKTIAAAAFKQLLATDQNFLDYTPKLSDDEGWSHGVNSATDQWIETHDAKVSHTIPGYVQELGKLFYINMGQYAVVTPAGGSVSKQHTFKPTDPATTRQDKAVTYLEKAGTGWNVLAKSMVSDGFVINGDAMGILTADFNLIGSGFVNFASSATFYPTATPTVTRLTSLHKLFNSQVALVVTDTGGTTTYGCRYRKFQVAYKKTMLEDAAYQPGCATFLTAGDPLTGALRSSYEFDKQMLDFTLEVDMASGSPEAVAVQTQKAEAIVITVTGGLIEAGGSRHSMIITIPIGKYQTSKPVVSGGMMRFTISGKAFFDFTTGKLFDIVVFNDVATYASAF